MNMMVAGPWSSFFRANASRANAPRPALGFRTGISRALIYREMMENQGLAVAADGSIWTLTMNSVSQFSHGQATLNKICDYTLYKPSPFGFPQHLAPVNFEHAFFIQSKNNQPVVVEYLKDDSETKEPVISTLAALPDQDIPTAITAASDGSMFVLGRSGKVWQYKRGQDKSGWHAIAAPAGAKLLQISAGAADFVLALARKDGLDQVLRLKDGLWIKHDDLPHQGVTWIAACEGKQYWWSSANSQKAGELHLIFDGKKLQSFTLEHPVAGLTATTDRSCYFFSFGTMGFMRAALGIVDQPKQNWPTMSPEQKQIYGIMSKGLGILDANGIRSQYTNINSAFSIWYAKLDNLECPAKFDVADWKTVKEQLQSELEYVQVVTTLSVNIGLLNGVIGQLYTNTYNQVIKLMSLPEKVSDQPQALIQVILGQIVDKLQVAAIDKVKEHVGAEAVGIAMACYQYANDAMARKHNLPDGSVPLTIACSELAATLNEIILESTKVHGTYQEAILTDWGKLSGCGEAIISGIWYWGPKANYEEIKNIGPAIALDFYKALMPAKWKIVLCEGVQSFHPPLNPFMRHVPRYCLMHKSVSDAKQNKIFWWWACMEVGAAVDQWTEGPFPNQKLMETIFTLPTTPLEFFTGQNGWKLTVATVPGYRPPPEGVAWQAYDNAGSPF